MLYQVMDGSVSVGGTLVLSHFNFEIKGNEKIALVGKNGAGKTTLLRLVAGELELDRDDKRQGPGIVKSRPMTIGMLHQQVLEDIERTVEEELLKGSPVMGSFEWERFDYEREYDTIFTGFGFTKADKRRKLKSFSGGEQTKIALIRLLLAKPDILLLDEPTNHLDIGACEWLEGYLRAYEHAVVMVSHDRFFLDRTVDVVYEVSGKRLTKYPGNYTQYRAEKFRRIALQQKAFDRQQRELGRLNDVIERFKHKPTKAGFACAKKKQIERMVRVEKPDTDDARIFIGTIDPAVPGGKWVLSAEHLRLGYPGKELLELTLRIRRGQKIGLLGPNGEGKSTFLKTAAGLLPALAGNCVLGKHVTVGYFDQHSANIQSEKSVLEHFHDLFPALSEKEVRSILGAYLFGGKAAARCVRDLSGGEKARLVLAELLQGRPNFLILDEPTNHMDIQAKEILESAFQAYTGTILFVSHDRYFIQQVAQSVLIFENHTAMYYPFGYGHYVERRQKAQMNVPVAAQIKAEDQALIDGLRAVPRAERHRLREVPEEEAYLDWKLRLVRERLVLAEEKYALLDKECRAREEELHQTQEWWFMDGGEGHLLDQPLSGLRAAREEAWRQWHGCCLEYWDVLENDSFIDKPMSYVKIKRQ